MVTRKPAQRRCYWTQKDCGREIVFNAPSFSKPPSTSTPGTRIGAGVDLHHKEVGRPRPHPVERDRLISIITVAPGVQAQAVPGGFSHTH